MTLQSDSAAPHRHRSSASSTLEEVCDAFERGWRDGHSPRIEDFLDRSAANRHKLLAELIAIELWWRRKRNADFSQQEYVARFPDAESLVRDAFVHSEGCLENSSRHESTGDLQPTTSLRPSPFEQPRQIPSSAQSIQGRFPPGALLAGRYRIVSLLGKGGMGEVYRADDLRLELTVALKVLPDHLRDDPGMRAAILNEVRQSRRITHRNVCRIHDIDDTGEHLYLAMEFIDGEDLATLLRRIGRMPYEKGVQAARELCLGLAAAHEQGVIHRDLKPANIMLDLRGRVRITDLGLAQEVVEGGSRKEGFAGTVAYAAPEQLLRGETSVQSDLFALGMILYELFTGTRVCPTRTINAVRDWHRSGTPLQFSELFQTLEPPVQEIIGRCLHPDPRFRPESAYEVATAFEEADPVKQAMALGKAALPDDLVEAAAASPVAAKSIALIGIVILLLLTAVATLSKGTHSHSSHALAPAVLADRSRTILDKLGLQPNRAASARRDSAFGFKAHRKIDGPTCFWYRESNTSLVPRFLVSDLKQPMILSHGKVNWNDPPLDAAGSVLVWLTSGGALLGVAARPDDTASTPTPAVDAAKWGALLSELTQLELAPSNDLSAVAGPDIPADAVLQWTAKGPGPADSTRVEAAFLRGALVKVRVDDGTECVNSRLEWIGDGDQRAIGSLMTAISLGLILWGVWTCWTQRTAVRIDSATVLRLGLLVGACSLSASLLKAHHVAGFEEMVVLQTGLARCVLGSTLVCLWYAAIEYSMRRYSPASLIGWTKLLRGRFRDPHVGRDIIAGVVAGVTIAAAAGLAARLASSQTLVMGRLHTVLNDLLAPRYALAGIFIAVERAIFIGLALSMLLLVCRRLGLKNWWPLIFVGLVAMGMAVLRGGSLLAWLLSAFTAVVALGVMLKFGLLAVGTMLFARTLLMVPFDLGSWHSDASLLSYLAVAALAGFGLVGLRGPVAPMGQRPTAPSRPLVT